MLSEYVYLCICSRLRHIGGAKVHAKPIVYQVLTGGSSTGVNHLRFGAVSMQMMQETCLILVRILNKVR